MRKTPRFEIAKRGYELVVRFLFLVLADGLGELIGARGVALATNARKESLDFVDIFPLYEFGNTLQIAAATVDKANVVQFIAFVHVENDGAGTRAFCRIRKHDKIPSLCLMRNVGVSPRAFRR